MLMLLCCSVLFVMWSFCANAICGRGCSWSWFAFGFGGSEAVSCDCCGGSKKPSSSEEGSCFGRMLRLDVVSVGVILYCTSE